MPPFSPRRPRPPLDQQRLEELALAYVGRFATTRAKLAAYLRRKLRERGWAGDVAPDIDALVERHARSGLIDDQAYASAKSQSLTRRGYGARRVAQALHAAGVAQDDSAGALQEAEDRALAAAMRFAERRRVGPFAETPLTDPRQREKLLAAMIRAGHRFELARRVIDSPPGNFTVSSE